MQQRLVVLPKNSNINKYKTQTIQLTNSSPSSSSLDQSNRKRVKRTVSSISLSPSKLTGDTSMDSKTKRQRTDATIKVKVF